MSTILCNAPFCQNTIAKKSYVYCWPHRWEREKYNVKRMELVMPLWAVWKCKICGPLNSNQVTKISKWHPTHHCRKCVSAKRAYCPIKAKITNTLNKEKRRDQYLARLFKLTTEQYNNMVKLQNNLCAICGKPQSKFQKNSNTIRSLAVDHNHITGKVRGLLCTSCNTAIGLLEENIPLIQKVIEYLRYHETA